MKKYQLNLFFISVMLFSFTYSDYAKLPIDKSSPFSKEKNKELIKEKPKKLKDLNKKEDFQAKKILNPDLKAELMDLENEYKAKRKKLKQDYKERRKEIYKKYGVKPIKKERSDSDLKKLKTK